MNTPAYKDFVREGTTLRIWLETDKRGEVERIHDGGWTHVRTVKSPEFWVLKVQENGWKPSKKSGLQIMVQA